jgi:hypothetical protein
MHESVAPLAHAGARPADGRERLQVQRVPKATKIAIKFGTNIPAPTKRSGTCFVHDYKTLRSSLLLQ